MSPRVAHGRHTIRDLPSDVTQAAVMTSTFWRPLHGERSVCRGGTHSHFGLGGQAGDGGRTAGFGVPNLGVELGKPLMARLFELDHSGVICPTDREVSRHHL